LDRGLNKIGQPESKNATTGSPDVKKGGSIKRKSKKRLLSAAFSLPLQTLHENTPLSDSSRPDTDFGFNPAKKSNQPKIAFKNPKAKKVERVAKPIKNGTEVVKKRLTAADISGPTVISTDAISHINTVKMSLNPARVHEQMPKKKTGFSGKVKFWTTKMTQKEKIAAEISDQHRRDQEYISLRGK